MRGTVTDADGPVRLARVIVQADDAQGDTLAVDFTDVSGSFAVTIAGTPSDGTPVATDYAIGAAFPNPATGARAVVRYTTPGGRPETAEVETFDMLGRRVTAGGPLLAGIYAFRLRFADGSVSETRKLTVAQSGVRVVAEQAMGVLDFGPPAVQAGVRIAATVYVTVERAGYVTETRTVDAAGGADLSVTLTAAATPTAAIALPPSVPSGTAVTLDGSGSAGASGEALRYSWAFGDGERGGTARVPHVYTAPGTYEVTLTVQGAFGATARTTAQIEVTNPPAPAGAAPVRVVVTGTTGGVIPDVAVSLVGGSASATTDGEGVAVIAGVPTGVPVALAVSKDGFATQRIALDLPAAAEQATTVEVTLGARQPAQTLRQAERGGTVGGVEGVRVELPVLGLVRADGTPVEGDVTVSLTPVDVSDEDEIGAFPGAFAGVTPDGPAPLILSYGVAEYVFEQGGEELDLAPGKTATIEIPIYAAQDETGADVEVGDPFPLWSLDETTGEWVLEGEGVVVASAASPTGLAFRAEVTHFSWWNCDVAPDPYFITPQLEGADGVPPLDPGETATIEGFIDGPGPGGRPSSVSTPATSAPLPVPPDRDVELIATARGGTLRGSAVVNGEAGESGTVTLVLTPIGGASGGSMAPDTSFVETLDTLDDVDVYTVFVAEGQVVRAVVGRSAGSSLSGAATVTGPDGSLIETQPYGFSPGSLTFLTTETGLYTLTVSATTSAPGAYTVDLIGRTPQAIAPGTDVSLAVGGGGELAVYTFEGTASQPFNLYLGSDDLSSASAQVIAPDGAELFDLSTRLNLTKFDLLPMDGTYAILIEVPSGPGTLVTSLRSVPTVEIGDVLAGSLREGERWDYLLMPAEDRLVRGGFYSPEAEGRASVIPLGGLPGSSAFNVQRLDAGTTYRLQVLATEPISSFTAAAAPVALPEPLTFDSAGRAEVDGEIEIPGGLRLYEIDMPTGSGLMAHLLAGGDSPLGTDASIGLARLRSDGSFPTFLDVIRPGSFVADGRREGSPDGVLEALGDRLEGNHGFVIAVGPESQVATGAGRVGDTPTGTFTLRADVVAPDAAIEVDDDLAECPSADTRSVRAAMFAATAGTTVTACAGRYADVVGVPVLDGATLEGTDRDDVVLAHAVPATRSSSSVVVSGSWEDGAFTLRELTLEPTGLGANLRGENLTVERVTVRPAAGVEAGTISGFITGRSLAAGTSRNDAKFEDIRVESAESGVSSTTGTGVRVLGSTFTGASSSGMVSIQGDDVTVQGNTFEMTEGQAIRLGLGGSYTNLSIVDNTVTIDGDNQDNSDIIQVVADGTSASTVRGNVITVATNRAGFLDRALRVKSGADAQVTVEDNEVTVTGDVEIAGLDAEAGGRSEIVVRNNVFDGVKSSSAFRLTVRTGGRVGFVNNSVRTADDADPSAAAPLVTVGSDFGASALPITVVNNVFQGAGGIGIQTGSGRAIASDYNLFFGFASPYGDDTLVGGNDIVGQDPQFSGDRLDVAASSPAVNAGASAAAFPDVPADDIDGTTRPQGAAVDIGAHEQ